VQLVRSPVSFGSPVRDAQPTVEIAASGTGALLVDFVSMMRADVRADGMFRVCGLMKKTGSPFVVRHTASPPQRGTR